MDDDTGELVVVVIIPERRDTVVPPRKQRPGRLWRLHMYPDPLQQRDRRLDILLPPGVWTQEPRRLTVQVLQLRYLHGRLLCTRPARAASAPLDGRPQSG